MAKIYFEHTFVDNRETVSCYCERTLTSIEVIKSCYAYMFNIIMDRFTHLLKSNITIDGRNAEIIIFGEINIESNHAELNNISLILVIPFLSIEKDTLIEKQQIRQKKYVRDIDNIFSKVKENSNMEIGDQEYAIYYKYLLFKGEVLNLLLSLFRQYLSEKEDVIERNSSLEMKKRIIDNITKKGNILNEKVSFLVIKEVINYTTSLDFETGNLCLILRCNDSCSNKYYKITLKMNVSQVLENFYILKDNSKDLLLKWIEVS